mgnify:CR=1 FL=1
MTYLPIYIYKEAVPMSIFYLFIIALCILAAALMMLSIILNTLFWYENLNGPNCLIPRPKPGLVFVFTKFARSMASALLCGLLSPFGRYAAVTPGAAREGVFPQGSPRPPVILIHGIYNNASAWLYMARRLRRAGYPVSTFSYKSFNISLDDISADLDAHVSELERLFPATRPVLIGHSLGGIIARTWLLRGENHHRPGALITLGTPHEGSKLAVFASGPLARHLVPGSDLLAALKAAPQPDCPCIALASPVDDAVLPASSLIPPAGWELLVSEAVGHFYMVLHPGTVDVLLGKLENIGK